MTSAQSRWFVCFLLVLMCGLIIGYLAFEKHLSGCFLATEKISTVFGNEKLDRFEDFGKLEKSQRGARVLELLTSFKKDFVGKPAEALMLGLGPSDGLFESTAYPNYLLPSSGAAAPLQSTEKGESESNSWTLVFPVSNKGIVREAFVWRKSCKN
jgi:hypothetical protein